MARDRRMMVLRAVVEDYIRSHEPVGSSALLRHHQLGVSSATLRNDMSFLEQEGYLTQPHTSAGRIPTEKGYRYFVDRLSAVMPLSYAQRNAIATFLAGSTSLEEALHRSARILAHITGQVAVVATPSMARAHVQRVELVPVSLTSLLCIVIADSGRIDQRVITYTTLPERTTLSELNASINEQAEGKTLLDVSEAIMQLSQSSQYRDFAYILEPIAHTLEDMADYEHAGNLVMAGASSLAQQQAQYDIAPLLDALEEQVVVLRLMNNVSAQSRHDGISVAIGSETHTPQFLHTAVVTSGYGREHGQGQDGSQTDPLAFVGSIGPTHMDYMATMAAVQAVAQYLTSFVAQDSDTALTEPYGTISNEER